MGGGASTQSAQPVVGLTRNSINSNSVRNTSDGTSTFKPSVGYDSRSITSPESIPQDMNTNKIKKIDTKSALLKHDDFIDDNLHYDEMYMRDYYDHDNNDDIDEDAVANAELYTHLSTSLDMESEDLLFNLLYFSQKDNQNIGNIGTMFNSAIEETVALHSENNTPYKLKPLPDDVINGLAHEIFNGNDDDKNNDCLVCRDVIENGVEIIKIPSCLHCFHKECVSKWFKYQSNCPICRVKITVDDRENNIPTCNNVCDNIQEEHKDL